MIKRPMCLICLLFMVFLFTAGWLGIPPEWGNPLPEEIRSCLKEHPAVRVLGEVESRQETEGPDVLILKNSYLFFQSTKFPLKNLKVNLIQNLPVPVGAVLLLSGNIAEIKGPRVPGEFDSRQYYSARQIYYALEEAVVLDYSADYDMLQQGIADLRKNLSYGISQAAGSDAPLFSAVVLGDKSGVDEETNLLYRMTGILHVFALSGLHITVLCMGLYKILMACGAGVWPSGLAAMCFAVFYAVLTGGSFSALRAVTMFVAAIAGKILGRVYDPLTALSFAAILMLAESPACLYDSGFLMSFAAVLGVTVVTPGLQYIFHISPGESRRGKPGKRFLRGRREIPGKNSDIRFFGSGEKISISKLLLTSLGVQLAALPVMLWFYGEVSLIGIFLNLLILPTAGILLVSAAVTALLGYGGVMAAGVPFIGPVLVNASRIAAWPGRILLMLYDTAGRRASGTVPCTWIAGRPELWQCGVYYLLLFMTVFLAGQCRKYEDRRTTAGNADKHQRRNTGRVRMIIFSMLAVALLVLSLRDHSHLKVACLDVGQGNGIVIQTPSGQCFLVDAGSSNKQNLGKTRLLPYLKNQGISYVDAVFITHTDHDHISGVRYLFDMIAANLTSVRVGRLILPDWEDPPDLWKELQEAALLAGAEVDAAGQGDVFEGKDIAFKICAPAAGASGADANEEGQVLELFYESFRALFPGDIGEETEKKLVEAGEIEDVGLLVVPHHGSKYSSSPEFLGKAKAEIAVVSCSENNLYGHPSPEAVDRLAAAGSQVEYTMRNGTITIETDGEKVWIERFVMDE